jgi:hypothetical protein
MVQQRVQRSQQTSRGARARLEAGIGDLRHESQQQVRLHPEERRDQREHAATRRHRRRQQQRG